MAGHSKWANIQHRKGRQDAARSKLFSRFSKEITVAAKLGGGDLEANARLYAAVEKAKKASVTRDVIQRAIASVVAQTDLGGRTLEVMSLDRSDLSRDLRRGIPVVAPRRRGLFDFLKG